MIRRVDENWAEGMLADKIGIFPISYVEVRENKESLTEYVTDRKSLYIFALAYRRKWESREI